MDSNNQTTDDQNQKPNVVNVVDEPESPAGSLQKEHESIFASEQEPKLHAEVIEAGVEKVSKMPMTSDHERVGIKLAKESVPVQTAPSGAVQLPLTKQQAKSILKAHKKVTDSILWLAILVLRQLKKMTN